MDGTGRRARVADGAGLGPDWGRPVWIPRPATGGAGDREVSRHCIATEDVGERSAGGCGRWGTLRLRDLSSSPVPGAEPPVPLQSLVSRSMPGLSLALRGRCRGRRSPPAPKIAASGLSGTIAAFTAWDRPSGAGSFQGKTRENAQPGLQRHRIPLRYRNNSSNAGAMRHSESDPITTDRGDPHVPHRSRARRSSSADTEEVGAADGAGEAGPQADDNLPPDRTPPGR